MVFCPKPTTLIFFRDNSQATLSSEVRAELDATGNKHCLWAIGQTHFLPFTLKSWTPRILWLGTLGLNKIFLGLQPWLQGRWCMDNLHLPIRSQFSIYYIKTTNLEHNLQRCQHFHVLQDQNHLKKNIFSRKFPSA